MGGTQGEEKEDVTVTWQNLWVTVADGNKRKPILQGLTGYAQPGKLLAIMGPSGCGKSTLLDALSGRLSSSVKQTGKILINGHKQALAYGTSPHASDCELPNNMLPVLEYETTFEVEAIKSIEDNEVDHQEEKGVFITWEDLWVTVSDGKNGRKAILRGLKGYAKPGQLLAIMGPSGCGKSTLLDALAGRLGSKSKQTGMILINGRKQALAYGTSAYVTEDDTILTTLTVGEAVYYSAQLQLPDFMSKSEKKERAEFTIREMGLQDAINTRIGGWGSKGISGGQKRRVSICIEILTHPRLLFLDEPTSGLDSAASYYVTSRIASLNKKNGIQMTIIASIHQPSNEIFQLFNNLCLLSSGKTVYFGPVSAANKFFSSNGFPCSSLQNPPDHFVKIINKDFEQEEDSEKGLAGGLTTEEAIHILVESYDSSEISHQVHKEIAQMNKRDSDAMEKKSHADFLIQCMVLTRRSFVNMYREVGYHWLRLLIYGALALSLGTMFFDIGSSSESIQARASLLVFVVTFLTFITVGAFPSFVEDMKVFKRERLNGHYGVTAYTIGNTLSSIPFLLLMSLIPGAVVYYLVGLHQGYQEFIYFASILFVSVFLVEGLMMIVASIVPNFLLGIIFGTGILGVMMLDGGFYRLPSDIPKPFWKYPLHYISFHKYAYQGLFKNEFQGLTFTGNNQDGRAMINISGEEILRNLWQVKIGYSKWNDVAILIGMAVTYRILFLVIIKSFEKVKPIVVTAMNNCPQAKFRFTKVTRLGAMA